MMAELYGRRTGSCKGKGGSMHIADLERGILGCNGIVGGGIPMAVGSALASQLDGRDDVAVSFFGEGACNQGSFHESLNLAAVWKLPIVFVVENNRYGQFSPMTTVTAVEHIVERATAYSMPGVMCDGQDVVATYGAAKEAVARARNGGGPTLLEMNTFRFHGHFEGEEAVLGAEAYRTLAEIDSERRNRDPVARGRSALLDAGGVEEDEIVRLEADIEQSIAAATEFRPFFPTA